METHDLIKWGLIIGIPLFVLILEIEVELLESSGAAINEETGILNWKLHFASDEVKKLRISYSVKYPKDKTLNL